jgi:4-amino-4-deoxy-L-arabinose transferase-like glycosyltransferase
VKWKAAWGDLSTGGVALLARLFALAWANGRFPPAADGFYYHTIGARVAQGLGSTWLWPDGKVTYAAHYPIGYPAMLAFAYLFGGPFPWTGGVLNALLGTLSAVAVHRLALQAARPHWALGAGLAVALHPGLVMYTPALMTEGVTAALLAMAAWAASLRSRAGIVLLGALLGLATLVRPQSLLLAPCLGLLCVPPRAGGILLARGAAVATAIALLVCAPWTMRNCVRMRSCALVSFNGGWNLLIGSSEKATGAWAPVDVPDACRTVWDEAEKDACFGREARRIIARDPARFVGLVPSRLAATFDYAGAPGFYLHESNPEAFDTDSKRRLGIVETIYERALYLGALAAAALADGPRRTARRIVSAVSGFSFLGLHGYLGVVGLLVALALRGKRLFEGPVLPPATFFALLATVAVHAVFFGSGRYSMVVFPLVTGLAFAWAPRTELERGDGFRSNDESE